MQADNHLLIVYRNQYYQKNEQLADDLLAIVFPQFKRKVEPSSKNKLLKTYITTKLFEALHSKHNEYLNESTGDVINRLSLPKRFLPTLCKYQKKSVFWLLKREQDCKPFPNYFEKLTAKDNVTTVYKHLYSRFIQTEPPDELQLPPGGILADEMGLGKTVEMLALILLNPRPQITLNSEVEYLFSNMLAKRKRVGRKVFCVCRSKSESDTIQCQKCSLWQHYKCVASFNDEMLDEETNTPYLCPSCWQSVITEYGVLETKATFIVSPNTIKLQWFSEIRCHIQPSLKVFIYDGVLKGKWINPRQLAQYDIVLTDYNVLRNEIYFTEDNISERKTRNKPLFMRVSTPLLMLNWWRVLLDEAQMVESNASKVAALVRMVPGKFSYMF